jgi:hypothetical protein
LTALAVSWLFALSPAAKADDTVYGNNATYGPDIADKYDVNIAAGTATLLQSYNLGPGNGRGMVVLGNIMYSTVVGDNHTDQSFGLTTI